jgi:hypothetical protein
VAEFYSAHEFADAVLFFEVLKPVPILFPRGNELYREVNDE